MPSKPLLTSSLLELIDLFEQSGQPTVDGDGQRLHGIPGWKLSRKVALSEQELREWTTRVGYAACYPASAGDDIVFVAIEEDEKPDHYAYRCPETFRRKTVSAAEIAVVDVNTERLLCLLAALLRIPQAKQSGIQSPRIDGKLWRLGEARIGHVFTPVWMVRSLDVHIDEVFQSLMDTRLPEQGLILCPGSRLPRVIRPPRSYRVAYLRDALVDYSRSPCMDLHYLERVLTSDEDGIKPSALPVEFANGVLRIKTKVDVWVVKGQRQADALSYMYEQAKQGRWELSASEILSAAYPERRTEESRKGLKMQDLFKGSVWRDFIANPEKGTYTFDLS